MSAICTCLPIPKGWEVRVFEGERRLLNHDDVRPLAERAPLRERWETIARECLVHSKTPRPALSPGRTDTGSPSPEGEKAVPLLCGNDHCKRPALHVGPNTLKWCEACNNPTRDEPMCWCGVAGTVRVSGSDFRNGFPAKVAPVCDEHWDPVCMMPAVGTASQATAHAEHWMAAHPTMSDFKMPRPHPSVPYENSVAQLEHAHAAPIGSLRVPSDMLVGSRGSASEKPLFDYKTGKTQRPVDNVQEAVESISKAEPGSSLVLTEKAYEELAAATGTPVDDVRRMAGRINASRPIDGAGLAKKLNDFAASFPKVPQRLIDEWEERLRVMSDESDWDTRFFGFCPEHPHRRRRRNQADTCWVCIECEPDDFTETDRRGYMVDDLFRDQDGFSSHSRCRDDIDAVADGLAGHFDAWSWVATGYQSLGDWNLARETRQRHESGCLCEYHYSRGGGLLIDYVRGCPVKEHHWTERSTLEEALVAGFVVKT